MPEHRFWPGLQGDVQYNIWKNIFLPEPPREQSFFLPYLRVLLKEATDTAATFFNTHKGDPSIGEFCLSHPDIKIQKDGNLYSINEGYYIHFPLGIKKYIKYCQVENEATNRPYTSRHTGSMIADIHRNLIKGCIFLYPTTAQYSNGKLRLVYECNR